MPQLPAVWVKRHVRCTLLCWRVQSVFIDSCTNFDQISRLYVGNINTVFISDPYLNIRKLHFVQSSEIMKAGFIGDQIFTWLKIENFLHELAGNPEKPIDSSRRSKLDFLTFKWSTDNGFWILIHFIHRTLRSAAAIGWCNYQAVSLWQLNYKNRHASCCPLNCLVVRIPSLLIGYDSLKLGCHVILTTAKKTR